jgi:hypothetical protein
MCREISPVMILMNKTTIACKKYAKIIISSYEFQAAIYMLCPKYFRSSSLRLCILIQERIRVGKEVLEAKRIEEDNERKRSGSPSCHPSYVLI